MVDGTSDAKVLPCEGQSSQQRPFSARMWQTIERLIHSPEPEPHPWVDCVLVYIPWASEAVIRKTFLRCSKLLYSGWTVRERYRTAGLLMAADQLTGDFSHPCFACWHFGLIPSGYFTDYFSQAPWNQEPPLVYMWASHGRPIQSTGAATSLCGLCSIPGLVPLAWPSPILCLELM